MLQLPSFGRHRTSCSSGVGWILNDLDLALQRSGRDALIVSLSLGATRRSMAKRNEGQDRRETNETKRWAVGPLGHSNLQVFPTSAQRWPFWRDTAVFRGLNLEILELDFYSFICSSRLFCFNFFRKISVVQDGDLCTMEGLCDNLRIRRSPKATEGSRDKSGKSLRSKALQAPRPSGGGCNCKSLNFRRKYSYKRMLKHVETRWNTKEFKKLETQRQSQHWHIFASFQKRFMTAMSRTMSKQNAVGKVKGPRILKNTCKMSHVKEPRINLTWRWIVQHDPGCSLCNQWKDLLKCPQFDLSKL